MEEPYGFKLEYTPSVPPQQSSPNFSNASLSYPPPQNDPNLHPPHPVSQNYVPPHPSSNNLYPPVSESTFPAPSSFSCSPQPSSHHLNKAYRWVDSSVAYGTVPPTAVQGGVDVDGHPIFVGRAYHEGDLIPAKVIPGKNVAFVAHDGDEHPVDTYQILCQQRFEWVPTHAGHLPPGAVQGGHTSEGEPLYIGRTYHEGSQTIGKIHPSHGVCYIPFDGKEIACPQYETLVLRL